jgi:hypothetical protein
MLHLSLYSDVISHPLTLMLNLLLLSYVCYIQLLYSTDAFVILLYTVLFLVFDYS